MTMPSLNPAQRRKHLTLLLIAFVLAVALMICFARNGTSMPSVSRRPGGGRVVTWQSDRAGFLFLGLPVWLSWYVVLVLISPLLQMGFRAVRAPDQHPIYDTRSRSQRPTRVAAALLSLLIPGLGQVFKAKFLRATVWMTAFLATSLLSLWMFAHLASIAGLILPIVLIVVFRVSVAFDAYGTERELVRASWTKRIGGVFAFVLIYLVASTAVTVTRAEFFGQSFRLPSGSMEPALLMGDYMMTTPLGNERIVRNQIVVFRWPNNETNQAFTRAMGEIGVQGSQFVSRVVGLPGDTLSMRAGTLFVNGRAVAEPFAVRDSTAWGSGGGDYTWQKNFLTDIGTAADYQPTRNDWGPLLVSRNAYFVLGDNRDNALDSRYRGLVAADGISLSPVRIYYSRDPGTGQFRWARMGKIVSTN